MARGSVTATEASPTRCRFRSLEASPLVGLLARHHVGSVRTPAQLVERGLWSGTRGGTRLDLLVENAAQGIACGPRVVRASDGLLGTGRGGHGGGVVLH